ncbi:hypothetical protein ABEB36_001571 [Hypothenemus hampei]|uniref:SIAH-type domain-containing protein n=1 Tax=Hypothenemus hampei TaxID=57062 RepID=A0ABD1FII9_HYPHA
MFESNVKMNFKVVPQRILDDLVCQKCFRYLSVLPIAITSEGQTCGRCIIPRMNTKNQKPFCLFEGNFSFEKVYNIPVGLLGYASYNSSFPCNNRMEGCMKTMKIEEVEEHEQICNYRQTLRCILCSFSGSGVQMINHFKSFHKKFYQNQGSMTLTHNNGFKDVILYLESSGLLLFIAVSYDTEVRLISLEVSCISNTSSFVQFAKILFAVHGEKIQMGNRVEILSEKLNICKGQNYKISIQVNDTHFMDSTGFHCLFKLLTSCDND